MTATDAPNLPLVIGIPFLCMFVVAIGITAIYWFLGRASSR